MLIEGGMLSVEYRDLLLEKEDGVAILTLNRPDKLNALSSTMREDLPKVFQELADDDDVRAVVVTGAGRGFCSGADVTGLAARLTGEQPKKSRRSILAPVGSFVACVAELEKPTIAAVNGVAAGVGLSLSLLCDMRISAESARFSTVWVRRGLVADGGATYLLPQVLGVAKALELMYTGDIIDAKEAMRVGLVSRVVPDSDLMKVAKELAKKIAKGPSIALELTKRAVYRDILLGLRYGLDFESYAQNICFGSEDHKEGVTAFFEKREAQFKGR